MASHAPVLGEFLGPAAEHIAAAVSFRGDLPYDTQCGVVRQLDRLVATLTRYLADLPLPDGLRPSRALERDATARAAPAKLALDRAAQSLRPAAAGTADSDDGDTHPAVGHLSAAADYLAAGRDLLQTHFTPDPAGNPANASYWAPLITSEPVTAALLVELADYAQNLARWIAKQFGPRRGNADTPTPAQLALRGAEPWLQLTGTALHAARQAHYPLPARRLLNAIPANTPTAREPPATGESVHDLCERIPLTADRLRYAAFRLAARKHWSPAITSASWRRDALTSAITSHGGEIILHALGERAGQLGLGADFGARLQIAGDDMAWAWKSWRVIAAKWDTMTTGTPHRAGVTPIAAEITDLALRTGRLAYQNPQWTPASSDTSLTRDPADLAQTPADIITVLTAIHHATDAISRIAAADHDTVLAAAASRRLYIPTRLMPETSDIPHPYITAPRWNVSELLAAYDTAIDATTRITTDLDNLATALDAPSSVLAVARQPYKAAWQRYEQEQQADTQTDSVAPVPGRTEKALRKLRIRDPALLLRAGVIDQAARDLVAEATAKARKRDIVAIRATPSMSSARHRASPPPRVASQDLPSTPLTGTGLRASPSAAMPDSPPADVQPSNHAHAVPRSAGQHF